MCAVVKAGSWSPRVASQVKPENPEWIWRDLIPAEMITVAVGLRGIGKGVFYCHVAADISNKRGLRNGRFGRVLISSHEDAEGIVLRPRLEAADANLDNIRFQQFYLPDQLLPELATYMLDEKIDLVIMDPFVSHLTGGVQRHNDSVRTVLDPLIGVLEMTKAAALIVEHPLKKVTGNMDPLNAIAGKGLVDAARMGFLFGADPANPERRLLANVKHNISLQRPTLAFQTDVVPVEGVRDEQVRLLLLEDEKVEVDPISLVMKGGDEDGRGRPAKQLAEACDFLSTYLYYVTVPVLASKVYEDAAKRGITRKTLLNARKKLGVIVDPPTGQHTMWALSDEARKAKKTELESVDPVAEEHKTDGEDSMISDEDINRFLDGDEREEEESGEDD